MRQKSQSVKHRNTDTCRPRHTRYVSRVHRQLVTRPSPALRRRLGFAASNDGVPPTRYCARLITLWLRDHPAFLALTPVVGPYTEFRVTVTETVHQQLRVEAARLDYSLNEVALRIFDMLCPLEVETFAAATAKVE
jgi:hypothetical protein